MAADVGEELQLEALSKKDHSWYPCRVSLCSSTLGSICMKVDFGSSRLEDIDIITTKEEAHAHLRRRSSPIQHGECFLIEGVLVLAMNKTRGNLLFDAEVLKVKKVRHLNKVCCKCKAEVRWLHPELKGETATVPSSSIRKLSKHNIENHPIVAEFLKSINLNESDLPPDFTSIGGSSEMNFHQLLQKQIEDITKLADKYKNSEPEDMLFEIKRVDPSRKKQCNRSVSSNISGKSLRRSTRIQDKLQLEMVEKDLNQGQLTQVDNLEFNLHMSPLAARAALASVVHELPVYHMKQEKVIMSPSKSTPGSDILRVECDATRMLFNSQRSFQQKDLLHGEPSSDIPLPIDPKAGKCGDEPLDDSQSRNSSKKISSNIFELNEKCLERHITLACSETQKRIDVVRNFEQQLSADEKKMQKKKRDGEKNTYFPKYGISESLGTIRRITRLAAKKEVENAICRSREVGIAEDKQVKQKLEYNKRMLDFGSTIAITKSKDTNEIHKVMVDPTIDRRQDDLTHTRRLTRSSGQLESVCMGEKQGEHIIPKDKEEFKKKYLFVDETPQTMRKRPSGSSGAETVCNYQDKKEVMEFKMGAATKFKKQNPHISMRLTRSAVQKEMKLKGSGAAETVSNDKDKKEVMEIKMESSPKIDKQNPRISMRLTCSAVPKEMKYLSSKTQELDTSKTGETTKRKSFPCFGDETSAAQGSPRKKRTRASCGHEPVFYTEHNCEVDLNVKTHEKFIVASSLSSSHSHISQTASGFGRMTRSQGKLLLEMGGTGPTSACSAHYATSMQSLPLNMNNIKVEQVKKNADDVDVKTPEILIVASSLSSSPNHISQRASNFRRITRSQGKLQLEVGIRGPPSACNATSVQSLPLNMRNIKTEQVKTNTGAFQDAYKKNHNVSFLDATPAFINSTFSTQDNMDARHEHSSDWFGTRTSPTAKNRERRTSVEDSASKWSRVNKRLVRTPSGPEKQPPTENVNSPTAATKSTRLATDRTSNYTTVTTRVTRSKLQKEMGNSIGKIELDSLRGEMKLESPNSQKKIEDSRNKIKRGFSSDSPRLTRSAIKKEGNSWTRLGMCRR